MPAFALKFHLIGSTVYLGVNKRKELKVSKPVPPVDWWFKYMSIACHFVLGGEELENQDQGGDPQM